MEHGVGCQDQRTSGKAMRKVTGERRRVELTRHPPSNNYILYLEEFLRVPSQVSASPRHICDAG